VSVCEGRCETRADVPYSPTNSATSTTPSEQHYFQQPRPQSAATQGATSERHYILQDATHAQVPPINSRRQDSAIAHYRVETSKESSSFAPPAEPDFSYSRRSPNDIHRPHSPRLTSHFAPQSSGPPPVAQFAATSPSSNEHVTSTHSGSGLDPSPRGTALPPAPDHVSPGTTRQQRYNVRFAANYTSTNMPTTQRLRPSSPLPATTTPIEPVESPPVSRIEPPAPRVEQPAPRERIPVPDAIAMILGQKHTDGPSPSSVDAPVQSAERCPGCLETYTAPLPAAWRQQSTATSAIDYAKAAEDFYARQRENAKAAEEDHDRWRQKHANCVAKVANDQGHDSNHSTNHGVTHNGFTNGHSNKRKSEQSHDDMTRSRRNPYDNRTTTAPPVRPAPPI
jgi:hypothetical protein